MRAIEQHSRLPGQCTHACFETVHLLSCVAYFCEAARLREGAVLRDRIFAVLGVYNADYPGEIHAAGSNGIAFSIASGTLSTSGVSPT